MTHLDAHIANLQAERACLGVTRHAVLQAALLGGFPFTAEVDDWQESTLGEVCEVGSSRRVLQKDWKSSGVPFLRGREVTSLAATGSVAPDLFIAQEHYDELKARSGVRDCPRFSCLAGLSGQAASAVWL
jgi:hypothetical protein